MTFQVKIHIWFHIIYQYEALPYHAIKMSVNFGT